MTTIQVEHVLHYSYSTPVYLEPQLIYLIPRTDHHLSVKKFSLLIEPVPSLLAKNIDAEGNLQCIAYFNELTDSLKITTRFTAENSLENPFDFFVYPFENKSLPLTYPENEMPLLKSYLSIEDDAALLHEYGNESINKAQNQLLDFLIDLAQKISGAFKYEFRESGDAFPPRFLIERGSGSCRDLSNLYLQVCRKYGIASRFVSGYFCGDAEQASHLHGWVEVYLPGAGWRGIDPTQGVLADSRYVPLAASAQTHNVAPVSGAFRGKGKSELDVRVVITEIL